MNREWKTIKALNLYGTTLIPHDDFSPIGLSHLTRFMFSMMTNSRNFGTTENIIIRVECRDTFKGHYKLILHKTPNKREFEALVHSCEIHLAPSYEDSYPDDEEHREIREHYISTYDYRNYYRFYDKNGNEIREPLETRKTPRQVNVKLRYKVLKRDNFKCVACGASPATNPAVELHVDHIHAWSKGGETILENLQTLCSTCNFGKGNS